MAGIPWEARWITATENQNATNTWICFRKEVDISEKPNHATARIAVDSKYWLWINGEMVVFEGGLKRGPNPNDTYYDQIDLAPFLKEGENTIAVLVWYFGKDGFSHNSSGRAGMVFEASIHGRKIISDGNWLARLHPAFEQTHPPEPNFRLPESNIRFNANNGLGSWYKENYEARSRGFSSAKTLGRPPVSPWNKLVKRPIPQWKDSGLKEYENIRRISASRVDTVVGRLPYNAQFTPYFRVKAEAGREIKMLTDQYTGGGAYNVRAEYITRGGIQEYENYGWMSGQKVYYILPKDVEVLDLTYRETGYGSDFGGSFTSTDPFLNRLWEKSRRTLYITMRDTYMDCPDRERAQWWGDVVIEAGEAFYALDLKSHLLQKKGMYELIGWQREDNTLYSPIPEGNWDTELPNQMLASVGYYGFWNYYRYTGDITTIADLYPGVQKYLEILRLKKDGTLEFREGDWTWGDWGDNVDVQLLENAWYYLALKGIRNMARSLGKSRDASLYEDEMRAFKKAFNKRFWAGNGYRSPDYENSTDDRGQALAVVSGLADRNKYQEIFKVFQRQEHASPYMEKYVLEALFQMGRAEYGLERMKKRFGKMVNDPTYTTLWEGWGIGSEGYGGGSVNHAWSGGGLTILSQYVVGISPLAPGFKSVQIAPQPALVDKASAKVMSVAGPIESSFENHGRSFLLKIQSPEAVQTIAGIPDNGWNRITMNGTLIWRNRVLIDDEITMNRDDDNSHIKFKLPGGNHVIRAVKE